jgi:hypothetical protein
VEIKATLNRVLDSASSRDYIILTLGVDLCTLTVCAKPELDSNVSTFLLRENTRLESSS